MKPSDFLIEGQDALTHDDQLMLVGPPGIGKTALCRRVAELAGADFYTSHPAMEEPPHIMGYPMLRSGAAAGAADHAVHVPFGVLYKILNANRLTLWVLDDYGHATETMQKAYMQVIHGGRFNGHTIPDCVRIFCATNDVRSMSGVQGIIEPAKGRMTIVRLEPNVDDWCVWALDNGLPALLVAFMRSSESTLPDGKHLLHDFQPTKEIKNSPSPRTWEWVGRRWVRGKRNFELDCGAVGEPAATQFHNFAKTAEKAPPIDSILMNPSGATVPDEPSLKFLVSTALARRVTPQNFDQVMIYLNRLDQPFRVLTILDAMRKPVDADASPAAIARRQHVADLAQTAAYLRWGLGEGAKVLSGS